MTAGLSAGSPLDALQSASAVPRLTRGTVTFVAGTTGAVSQHTVFSITGLVMFAFNGMVTADLTSGGAATITYGRAAAVNDLVSIATATTLDIGHYFTNASDWAAAATFMTTGTLPNYKASSGEDITADILTATITGGSIEYVLLWIPLSAGATVTLGAELVAS